VRPASSTAVLGTGDIDDPMWVTKGPSGTQEGLPICSASRGKDLGAQRTAVLFVRPANIMTMGALH